MSEAAVAARPARPLLRAILLFVNFFLVLLAYYQVKPASRSLFLEYGNAAQLPYLWTASAALLLALMPLYGRLLQRYRRLHVVLGTCGVVLALLVGFRLLWLRPGLPVATGFYLLVDIFSVVLVEQFWSLTDSVYRGAEGRRWYGLIASGGLVGGAAGGLLAAWLVAKTPLKTADLLLVSAGLIALMMWLTLRLAREGLYDEAARAPAQDSDARALWAELRGNRYLALIAAMLLISQIAGAIVDYQFMTLVQDTIADRERRTEYLSDFLSLLSGLALVANLTVTPLLLRRYGAALGILVQPVLLGLSAMGFTVQYRLWMAATMKICDRALSYSINRSARELLYIGMDASLIYRAKAWIDMVGYRAFTIAGSVVILLLTQWLPWRMSVAALGWVTVLLCGVWIAAALAIRRWMAPDLNERLPPGA